MGNDIEVIGNKVSVSWTRARQVAKASGLRSKSSRKIAKRFKLILHAAIEQKLGEGGKP